MLESDQVTEPAIYEREREDDWHKSPRLFQISIINHCTAIWSHDGRSTYLHRVSLSYIDCRSTYLHRESPPYIRWLLLAVPVYGIGFHKTMSLKPKISPGKLRRISLTNGLTAAGDISSRSTPVRKQKPKPTAKGMFVEKSVAKTWEVAKTGAHLKRKTQHRHRRTESRKIMWWF